MPAYSFHCRHCGNSVRRILRPDDVRELRFCKCGYAMHRTPKAPTTQITETLDNGLMPRSLERPAEAETIHNERAHGKKGVI